MAGRAGERILHASYRYFARISFRAFRHSGYGDDVVPDKPTPDDNEAAMRNAVAFVEETRPEEIPADDTGAETPDGTKEPETSERRFTGEENPVAGEESAESDWEKYGPSNKRRS